MNHEIDIQSIRSRPRFKFKSSLSKDEIKHGLSRQFQLQNKVLGGYIGEELSVIRLRKEKQKYWAPQLQIRLETDVEDSQVTIVRGLFGPRPAVWTFFIFLYILGGTILSFFAMIWFVQLRLDVSSQLIVWAWVGMAIIAGTYAAAKIGQRLAKEHIKVLKDFMEKVVKDELCENDK